MKAFTPHLQLFNYVIEGYIAYTGFDYRIKEELQNVVFFFSFHSSASPPCPPTSSARSASAIFYISSMYYHAHAYHVVSSSRKGSSLPSPHSLRHRYDTGWLHQSIRILHFTRTPPPCSANPLLCWLELDYRVRANSKDANVY